VVGHGVAGAGVTVALIVGVLIPTVGRVDVGAIGLIVVRVGGGLRPPAPSSVEPIGTPSRPTAMEAMPVGDDADAAGWARVPLPITAHEPETVPAMPPPSKVDIPTPVPAMELPIVPVMEPLPEVPVVVLPEPPIAVLEVDRPKDAWGIEPPMPEHAVAMPVVASGDVPDPTGLVPGVVSAVAPSGIPVGATGAPGPMPSGDVMPTAGVGLPICAKTGLLPQSAATVATINLRFITASI
jgi:hypothetical protein